MRINLVLLATANPNGTQCISSVTGGLGPTRLMSFLSTFTSEGSSSIPVRERKNNQGRKSWILRYFGTFGAGAIFSFFKESRSKNSAPFPHCSKFVQGKIRLFYLVVFG